MLLEALRVGGVLVAPLPFNKLKRSYPTPCYPNIDQFLISSSYGVYPAFRLPSTHRS